MVSDHVSSNLVTRLHAPCWSHLHLRLGYFERDVQEETYDEDVMHGEIHRSVSFLVQLFLWVCDASLCDGKLRLGFWEIRRVDNLADTVFPSSFTE